ncbi:hypothetical protein [Candidatus Phytoplasma asteris]|uniref:Uncharacterized protein n=1 Tax=Candidatus Phytoplasma asteris TaxID=85620 RepID=A0ABZ3CEQ6_9MOLU
MNKIVINKEMIKKTFLEILFDSYIFASFGFWFNGLASWVGKRKRPWGGVFG